MSIRLLIFFTMYIMFYLGAWYWKIKLTIMSDLLYYLIPVAAVVFLNFIKHIVELFKNGDTGYCLGKENFSSYLIEFLQFACILSCCISWSLILNTMEITLVMESLACSCCLKSS